MSGPPFPVPSGWFQIGFEDEVAPGELKRLHCFGEDLVWWRDDDGAHHLFDAYCPHLGAHLGVGGRVEGSVLRCPFHAWAFEGSGRCVEIPYAQRIPAKAAVRAYPVQLVGPFVMAWFHPGEELPGFSLPQAADFEGLDAPDPDLRRLSFEIAAMPQELAENTYDPAHFATVHGHPEAGEIEETGFEAAHSWMRSSQTFPSSRGPVAARIDVDAWGPGFSVTRYAGLVEMLLFGTATPIEAGHTLARFTFLPIGPRGEAAQERIIDAFVAEVGRQVEQDIPVWENKVYRRSPPLVPVEAGIVRFREWYRQFYVS